MTDCRPGIVVVVASIDARSSARQSLTRFAEELRGRGEVILVDASNDPVAVSIARDLPGVRVIQRPPGLLAPKLWRDGLLATDAPLVAFSTTAMIPAPGWLDALLARLEETGAAAVGGPIEPAETLAAIDRAVYLLRYLNYLRPLSPAVEPPGDNAIYRRECLNEFADGFWEAETHRHLRQRGEHLAMALDAVVTFQGGCPLAPTLVRRFRHACRYGAGRATAFRPLARLARLAASPLVPLVLMARIVATLRARGQSVIPWWKATPALAILAASWAAGEALGTLRASHHSSFLPLGERIKRGSRLDGQGPGRTHSNSPLARRSVLFDALRGSGTDGVVGQASACRLPADGRLKPALQMAPRFAREQTER